MGIAHFVYVVFWEKFVGSYYWIYTKKEDTITKISSSITTDTIIYSPLNYREILHGKLILSTLGIIPEIQHIKLAIDFKKQRI